MPRALLKPGFPIVVEEQSGGLSPLPTLGNVIVRNSTQRRLLRVLLAPHELHVRRYAAINLEDGHGTCDSMYGVGQDAVPGGTVKPKHASPDRSGPWGSPTWARCVVLCFGKGLLMQSVTVQDKMKLAGFGWRCAVIGSQLTVRRPMIHRAE